MDIQKKNIRLGNHSSLFLFVLSVYSSVWCTQPTQDFNNSLTPNSDQKRADTPQSLSNITAGYVQQTEHGPSYRSHQQRSFVDNSTTSSTKSKQRSSLRESVKDKNVRRAGVSSDAQKKIATHIAKLQKKKTTATQPFIQEVNGAVVANERIMPSVIQGTCMVCKTASCINCAKCGSLPCNRTDRDCETATCLRCSNKGGFCSVQRNREFEAVNGGLGSTETMLNNGAASAAKGRACCATSSENDCSLSCEIPRTVFIPRSQGANTARELAGWEEFIHQFNVGEYYVTTGHVLGYSRSFRNERIARALFGDTVLSFAGSQVADRGRCEIIADNFGLSPFMRGAVAFNPLIENIIFDNQFFIGLDPWLCGLYARIHIPVVHTRWDLGMCETRVSQPKQLFPQCYQSENAVPTAKTIIQALSGDFTFGDMKEPWQFGRFVNGVQTKTGVADVDLILGYNAWQCETWHFGFYAQVVAPTGNKVTGRTVFEPLIGNGKHWEAGVGISGHIIACEWDDENSLGFYVEGNATHMFRNRQVRSFDFCRNGIMSRYLLLKELRQTDTGFEYTGNLVNAINFATRPVDISVAVKGDISAKLSVRTPCLIFDIGYNFYGRTREEVSCVGDAPEGFFGIKGTEGVCALDYQTVGTNQKVFGQLVDKIPLNSTQSNATIRHSAPTDNAVAVVGQQPTDKVVTAFSRQTGPIEGADVIQAFSSSPAVVLNSRDLHLVSGTMPSYATHKFFAYFGYDAADCDRWYNPYAGFGGEIEVDALACSERSALNQWSIWVKGGFEF